MRHHRCRGLPSTTAAYSKSNLNMVATAPPEKKLQKVELIKLKSNYIVSPLQEELGNDEIFVSSDAVVVLKYCQ
jgi:hypothetical protein